MNKNRRFVFWLIVMLISSLMTDWVYSMGHHLMRVAFAFCQIGAVYELWKLTRITCIRWWLMVYLLISAYLLFFLKPVENHKDFTVFVIGLAILITALILTKSLPLPNGTNRSAGK